MLVEHPSMEKPGVACIKSQATEEDLNKAQDGVDKLDEDAITYFSYLARCDQLIPARTRCTYEINDLN